MFALDHLTTEPKRFMSLKNLEIEIGSRKTLKQLKRQLEQARGENELTGAEKQKSLTSYLINKTLHIQPGTEPLSEQSLIQFL